MHSGECLFGKHVCYRCGKTGHISKNCKEDPLKKNDEQEKKGKARVFALAQERTTEDPNAGNFEDEIILRRVGCKIPNFYLALIYLIGMQCSVKSLYKLIGYLYS